MCYQERMQKSTSRPCRHSNQASEPHPQKQPRHMTEVLRIQRTPLSYQGKVKSKHACKQEEEDQGEG